MGARSVGWPGIVGTSGLTTIRIGQFSRFGAPRRRLQLRVENDAFVHGNVALVDRAFELIVKQSDLLFVGHPVPPSCQMLRSMLMATGLKTTGRPAETVWPRTCSGPWIIRAPEIDAE